MATKQSEVEQYNYASFGSGGSDFLAFRTKLQVGASAPDFTATSLETGQPVQLSEFWRDGDLIIEFGSLT